MIAYCNLLFGLTLSERFFKATDKLSKTQQTQSLPTAEPHSLAWWQHQNTRSNEEFKLFSLKLFVFSWYGETIIPKKRKAPKWWELVRMDPTTTVPWGSGNGCVTDWFDQSRYAIYQLIEAQLLKSANREDFLHWTQRSQWGCVNEMDLSTQLDVPGFLEKLSMVRLFNNLEFFGVSQLDKVFFKRVCFISRLVLVMPTMPASTECSFLVMRRLHLTSTPQQMNMFDNVYVRM